MAASVTWTIVAAFLLLIILWWNIPGRLWSFYRISRAVRGIPGWPVHWFWGNMHQIKPDEDTIMRWLHYVQETRHKVTRGWFGPFFPVVGIQHHEPLRKILKEPKQDSAYRLLSPWLGDGLLISGGKKWYRNRHLLTPAFHFDILKPYMSVYNSSLEAFLEKWSAAAGDKKPVKLFDSLSLLSLDIILQCAFSHKSNCQNASDHVYIQSVRELTELIADRFVSLLYRFDWIYYFTSHSRRMQKACKVVHAHSKKVIEERKRALGIDGSERKVTLKTATEKRKSKYLDFLDILLTAVDKDGVGMTDLEIRDEVDTFMFEGHDTTTSGMSWTLYCLAKYPEHQEKVREEVRRVLNGREWLEYDDLKELKYTQWCIKEAMRLYPPVFQIFRKSSEEVELDGHVIPKGVNLNIVIYVIHRHPDAWENPNDFDPLRFHPDNASRRDPYAYIPFSAGHRNCIGQTFAMNEMRTIIASVVHRFSIALVADQKIELAPKVILKTVNDIEVTVEPLV